MSRMTLKIAGPIAGETFDQLLHLLASDARVLGLVWEGGEISNTAKSALDRLFPYLLIQEKTRRWPGTEIANGFTPADRWLYSFNGRVADVLADIEDNLFHWQNPALPQDLHLLDAGGNPILGSTTTEGDAWLSMSKSRWDSIAAVWPALNSLRIIEE